MLSVKHGGIKYHFLSFWYDSTWDWTQVSRAIGKNSNHHANVQLSNGFKKKNPLKNESNPAKYACHFVFESISFLNFIFRLYNKLTHWVRVVIVIHDDNDAFT